ncbi:MAG: His/Gly/Thr/Pro-type tRNA ligase C-terminal domain-containing protein [Patescibacteria group bacterium]
MWLAPKQIAIVPVVDKFYDKCFEIASEMKKYDLRVSIDITEDSFSKKIRNAELDKIPFILIIGEKEIEN